MKLNLGSGNVRLKGFVNIDLSKYENVDFVCDLNKDKLPFKNNSVDFILANNVLEHLDSIDNCLAECHRVLKDGGVLSVQMPYYNSSSAIRPDHKTFFNYKWFKYWTENESEAIQSKEKPTFKVKKHSYDLGRLGKILKFIGKNNIIKLSKVFGEVIEVLNTELIKIQK